MNNTDKVSTKMIYDAITYLRAERDLLDDVIEQVEALSEDPPRQVRRRRRRIGG